jgi:hypothetical protein
MRNAQLLATCCLIVLGTAGSGWLHGRLINRWGEETALQTAAQRLEQPLPLRLGPWRLVKSTEMEAGALEILQSAGHLQGIYSNDETGDSVIVQLVAGPSGPISAHTPEICYAGQEYAMAGERRRIAISDLDGREHSFWQLQALSQHLSRPDLHVLYGWSAGNSWEATDGPRFAFGGLPVLYKLQLARVATPRRSDHDLEPSSDFLARFLSHIQPRLVESSRLSPLAL